MNRIAIVGHASSGYHKVEQLLKNAGMAEAAPSRREGMSVHNIQASLCKTYSAVQVEKATTESDITQIKPSTVWQSLALDFLLGNMQQPGVWGWAATNTLPLLNVWHEADENICFVLVYQHPMETLQSALEAGDASGAEQLLNNWVAYHSALLTFHLRHPTRCQLVHAQQVLKQPELILKSFPDLTYNTQKATDLAGDSSTLGQTLNLLSIEQFPDVEELEAKPLAAYLQQQLVDHHPALALYAELQASANQPASRSETITTQTAWQHFQSQQTALLSYLTQFQHVHAECSKLKEENETLKNKQPEPASLELQQENAMLLEQLQLVQEELEKLYQQGSAIKPLNTPSAGPLYGADERIKRQLTYRLGSVVVRSKGLKDYLLLPLALKREHKAFQQDKQATKGEKLPPIERYADAHKAEQAKRHLSYRLGQVIMANASSPIGWIKLPFALSSEAKVFRQERKSG